tara:strand:- start:676 stop:1092 length:417 start_codon:yes stop_codon:yes gene_type:complete
MDEFENKYGFKEDKKIKAFHQSRRMFCIYENKLFIAESNLPYSHAIWFEREGWISREKDELMDEIIRGIVNKYGDVYFYIGYDFEINKNIESIFFTHLKELVEKLNLKSNTRVFGGLIKQKFGKWPPRKEYGEIKENL